MPVMPEYRYWRRALSTAARHDAVVAPIESSAAGRTSATVFAPSTEPCASPPIAERTAPSSLSDSRLSCSSSRTGMRT